MNQEELMKILPHRRSMLLVEEAYVEDGKAHGKYHVRGDEWFLDGHFDDNPVVPGVILCEMLAQSACVLLADGCPADTTPFFTSMDKVRFRNPVRPGDTYETECTILKSKGPFYFCQGRGFVDGKLCAQADFSFALIKKG